MTSPLQPVADSKSIAQMGYDEGAQQYHVQFRQGGSVYVYNDVDKDTADAIAVADSKGAEIQARLVRTGLNFTKIDPPDIDQSAG